MGNAEEVHVFIAIVLCDMAMQSASVSMNSRGQGHFVTLAKGHLSVLC